MYWIISYHGNTIRTSVRDCFSPSRTTAMKTGVDEDVGKQKPFYLARMQNAAVALEYSFPAP